MLKAMGQGGKKKSWATDLNGEERFLGATDLILMLGKIPDGSFTAQFPF